MNIWLIQIGEPLPISNGGRKMRTGWLADELLKRGHTVKWWASAFEHQRKLWLHNGDLEVHRSPRFTLHLLSGCGYKKNVSIRRYLDHLILAVKFRRYARKSMPPDVIVASFPCHHIAFEALCYAKEQNIPFLVDIRDLWPDNFLSYLRQPTLSRLTKLALIFDFHRVRQIFTKADSLVAVSQSYLNWALEKVGRKPGRWERVLYLGYQAQPPMNAAMPAEKDSLQVNSLEHEPKKIVLFIGTYGLSYELWLVLAAAQRMQAAGKKEVCFILAGTGEQAEQVQRQAASLDNLHNLGWIGAAELQQLLSQADIGLLPYAKNATQSIPNKFFEYLSAGLPLVSSLPGELADLITRHNLGLNYQPGDVDNFCQSLETILTDDSQRRSMAANALSFFQQYGDATKIYKDYADYIERLTMHYRG